MAHIIADGVKAWMLQFLKNSDVVKREILSIKENSDGYDLVLETIKGTKYILVRPQLTIDQALLEKVKGKTVILCVQNSRHNLDQVITNWQQLIVHQKLCMFFVNTGSSKELKWMLYPQTHNSLIDKGSLKLGLESLFSTVDEVK